MAAPTIVKFEDPLARRKRISQEWAAARSQFQSQKKKKEPNFQRKVADIFDVEKARYEILRFGIENDCQKERQLNAKHQLLVRLGAKPPKNEYTNYKKLKQEIKLKKESEAQASGKGYLNGSRRAGKLRGKPEKGIDITSGFGKLRNGELVVGVDARKAFKRAKLKANSRTQHRFAGFVRKKNSERPLG